MEKNYKILDFDKYNPYDFEIGEIVKLYENDKYIDVIITDLKKETGDISYEYIYDKNIN